MKNVLKLKDGKNRIEFNEISPAAVTNALQHPREIDYNLVDAQQARRVLDRLVGYKLSPLLCKRIHSGLSAGRVQSVALRLIVDREREIQAFVPEEYWNLTAEGEISLNSMRYLPSLSFKTFFRCQEMASPSRSGSVAR